MTFRKDSLLHLQSQVLYIVIVVLCFALIPIIGLGLSLLYMFPFVILLIVNSKLHKEYITINEIGISCQKAGVQLWAYEWGSIAALKRSSRFLMPSMEIITYSNCGQPEQYAAPNHYFQLGWVAQKAIDQFYNP